MLPVFSMGLFVAASGETAVCTRIHVVECRPDYAPWRACARPRFAWSKARARTAVFLAVMVGR